MKKLTVIVKPANREDVIDIMESCAVYGVMETDITGYGNQMVFSTLNRLFVYFLLFHVDDKINRCSAIHHCSESDIAYNSRTIHKK